MTDRSPDDDRYVDFFDRHPTLDRVLSFGERHAWIAFVLVVLLFMLAFSILGAGK